MIFSYLVSFGEMHSLQRSYIRIRQILLKIYNSLDNWLSLGYYLSITVTDWMDYPAGGFEMFVESQDGKGMAGVMMSHPELEVQLNRKLAVFFGNPY